MRPGRLGEGDTEVSLLGGARTALSQLLADCPDPQSRDPDRAVALAREAIAKIPHVLVAWDALGVALYRAGAADEALAPLRQSVKMTSGGSAKTRFFLAMALGKDGKNQEARMWYDKAIGWTQKNRPNDPALRRLRRGGKPAGPFRCIGARQQGGDSAEAGPVRRPVGRSLAFTWEMGRKPLPFAGLSRPMKSPRRPIFQENALGRVHFTRRCCLACGRDRR